eukprot:3730586-Lingulodinium_polyedra.AAC.1
MASNGPLHWTPTDSCGIQWPSGESNGLQWTSGDSIGPPWTPIVGIQSGLLAAGCWLLAAG